MLTKTESYFLIVTTKSVDIMQQNTFWLLLNLFSSVEMCAGLLLTGWNVSGSAEWKWTKVQDDFCAMSFECAFVEESLTNYEFSLMKKKTFLMLNSPN